MKPKLLASVLLPAIAACAVAQNLRTPPPTASGPAPTASPVADTVARLGQARQLRAAGEYRAALNIVSELRARDERNIELLNEEGELCWLLNQFDEARKAFLSVRSIQANDFRANLGLGRVFGNTRVWRQAIYYLDIAATVAPPDRIAETLTFLASAHRNNGAINKGLPIAKRAVEIDAKSFDARVTYVQLLLDAGDVRAARDESGPLIALAREEVDRSAGEPEPLDRLRRAYTLRREVLRDTIERLYQANPDGTRSDRLLVGKEREATENLKELADVMIREAELNLTFAYMDSLTFARRAAEYTPTDVDALLVTAELQRTIARNRQAAETYRQILAIDPAHRAALEALAAMGEPATPNAASQPATQPSSKASDAPPAEAPTTERTPPAPTSRPTAGSPVP